MLSLLLDENISPEVARQIQQKRSDIAIMSLSQWQQGAYMGQSDEVILKAAMRVATTLVTFDQKTILPLLVQWGQVGTDHAGVVFIDDRSIAPYDFGGLVRSLTLLWDVAHADDWTNRVDFLSPSPRQ